MNLSSILNQLMPIRCIKLKQSQLVKKFTQQLMNLLNWDQVNQFISQLKIIYHYYNSCFKL